MAKSPTHKQLPLRLKPGTHAKLVKMAEKDGRSLNGWIEHHIDTQAEIRGIATPETTDYNEESTISHYFQG